MDPQIEELKELVRHVSAVSEDTNRTVHKMRRAVRWGRIATILWWLLVLAVSGAAYYYYLQPYVNKLEQFYGNAQHSAQQVQSWEQQVQNFFQKLNTLPVAPTSTPQSQ